MAWNQANGFRTSIAAHVDFGLSRLGVCQDWRPRVAPQIVTVLAQTRATLLWVNDLFEDEIHFNQNPSQQGIFLKQRVHVVAVFVIPK